MKIEIIPTFDLKRSKFAMLDLEIEREKIGDFNPRWYVQIAVLGFRLMVVVG